MTPFPDAHVHGRVYVQPSTRSRTPVMDSVTSFRDLNRTGAAISNTLSSSDRTYKDVQPA
jgi:hypothetical protein